MRKKSQLNKIKDTSKDKLLIKKKREKRNHPFISRATWLSRTARLVNPNNNGNKIKRAQKMLQLERVGGKILIMKEFMHKYLNSRSNSKITATKVLTRMKNQGGSNNLGIYRFLWKKSLLLNRNSKESRLIIVKINNSSSKMKRFNLK